MHFLDAFGDFLLQTTTVRKRREVVSKKAHAARNRNFMSSFEKRIATLANPTVSPSPEGTRQREMVHLTVSQRSFALIHKV